MPELPEVETIRRQLSEVLPGQILENISVLRAKSFQGGGQKIVGRRVLSVLRRAKILRISLNGSISLLVHLKMTGQLIYQNQVPTNVEDPRQAGKSRIKNKEGKNKNIQSPNRIVGGHPSKDWVNSLPSSHTRVIMTFSKGKLYFNDQRVFGWVKMVSDEDLEHEHRNFGPDIINEHIVTDAYFYDHLQRSRQAIKVKILDQKRFAGVGNIYASDGLYLAKIDPRRSANSLNKKEARVVLKSLREVLHKGIKLGGATESDYLHIDGMGGSYQNHFLTYKKDGDRCGRKKCGGMIEKIKLGGRGSYFCPRCQR